MKVPKKGPKLDPPGGPVLIQEVHFVDPFGNTFPARDPKLDPQQVESGAFLEVRF